MMEAGILRLMLLHHLLIMLLHLVSAGRHRVATVVMSLTICCKL